MKSRSVGTLTRSRIPTSPFARPVLRAASICSATRLFVCLVLSRNCSPLNVNLNHQTLPRLKTAILLLFLTSRSRFLPGQIPKTPPIVARSTELLFPLAPRWAACALLRHAMANPLSLNRSTFQCGREGSTIAFPTPDHTHDVRHAVEWASRMEHPDRDRRSSIRGRNV